MKTVAECSSVDEASVIRSLLLDSGIEAYVPEELSVTYRGQPGGFHVQVAEEDEAEALRILSDARK
jgi:hypothetical protein